MAREVPPQSGAHLISHDRSKDWSHKLRFGSVNPLRLPDTLGIVRMPVDDQDEPVQTSFCTAFGTSKGAAYHYGIDFSPEWQTAKIGEYNSVPILNGTDPKTAMEAAVLNGFLPKSKALYTLTNSSPGFIADYRNWSPALDPLATGYAPTGYYSVTDESDTDVFDDIRSALYKSHQSNDWWPVMAFGKWFATWNSECQRDGFVTSAGGVFSVHCYIFVDWIPRKGVPYLVAQLSDGTDYGDKGFVYFSREAVNEAWKDMYSIGAGLYIFRSTGNRNLIYLQIMAYLKSKLAYLMNLAK